MVMRTINNLSTIVHAADQLRHVGRRKELASDRALAAELIRNGGVPHETQDDEVAFQLADYIGDGGGGGGQDGFNTEGRGIYIGAAENTLLFYDSDQPSILYYGKSRTGKFSTSQSFQLANLVNRTICALDPKGEFYLRSAHHRARYQGGRVFALCADPHLGIPTVGFNPLAFLAKLVDAGENIDSDAREIVEALFSATAKKVEARKEDEHWTVSQAKDFFFLFIVAYAYLEREGLTLGGLFDFVHEEDKVFWDYIALWKDHPGVSQTCRQTASALLDEFVTSVPAKDADGNLRVNKHGRPIWDWGYKHDKAKQYLSNIRERMRKAIRAYSPGSNFRKITDQTDFDVSILAEKPSTLYIVLPARYPKMGERWATLMFDSLFRELGLLNAVATRPTWIMDELTTLPPIPDYQDRINRMASIGHQFLSYAHSPGRFDEVYGKGAAEALEECSALTIGWHVGNERLLGKVADLAGERTVAYESHSVSDNVDADGSSLSMQTTKIRNATKGQVSGIAKGRAWILLDGYPSVGVLDRPAYFEVPEYAAVIGDPIEWQQQAAE